MSFPSVAATDPIKASHIMDIVQAFDGSSNKGVAIKLTDLNSSSSENLKIQNNNASGIALRIYDNGGANVMALFQNGVNAQIGRTVDLGRLSANYVTVAGAAAGSNPSISAVGSDANPSLNLAGKGTGNVNISTGGLAIGGTAIINSSGTFVTNLIFTDATYDIGASGATRPRSIYTSGAVTFGGAITAPTATNTINSVIINAGAVSGITTITGTGAMTFSSGSAHTIGSVTVTGGAVASVTTLTMSDVLSATGSVSHRLGAGFNVFSNTATDCYLQDNINWTGSAFQHRSTGIASEIYIDNTGAFSFRAEASQVAGTAYTATTNMKIDINGNVTIRAAASVGNVAPTGSGLTVGAASTNNDIWNASQGAGTAALYIGNAQITVASDMRLKTDIRTWEGDALGLLNRLRVVDHLWDDPSDRNPFGKSARGRYVGMLAQEMVDIVPWVINAPDRTCPECRAGQPCQEHDSYWFAEYHMLVPTLVRAIQQLETEVRRLKERKAA